jgi:hypothetical protein
MWPKSAPTVPVFNPHTVYSKTKADSVNVAARMKSHVYYLLSSWHFQCYAMWEDRLQASCVWLRKQKNVLYTSCIRTARQPVQVFTPQYPSVNQMCA